MARNGLHGARYKVDGQTRWAYGATLEEAQKTAEIRQALAEAGIREVKSTMSVSEWSQEWLLSYKRGVVSDAWYKQIESIVYKYIVPVIGSKRLIDVKPIDISRLYNSNSHLSDSHLKKISQITRQIFDSAEENDLVVKSPAKHIKVALTGYKQGYRPITAEERSLTIKTADKYPEEGLFFLIMLWCGCRPQEVCRLKMLDYDSKKKILHITAALKADGSTGRPKSQAGNRDIPVPDVLADRLDALGKKPNEYIVTSLQGRPLLKTSMKRLWGKFKRHMDIENGAELFRNQVVKSTIAEDLQPYCYRHTYCTDLRDAGVPITVARELMGHSDIKVTAQIYTHKSEASFEDAREKINRHAQR